MTGADLEKLMWLEVKNSYYYSSIGGGKLKIRADWMQSTESESPGWVLGCQHTVMGFVLVTGLLSASVSLWAPAEAVVPASPLPPDQWRGCPVEATLGIEGEINMKHEHNDKSA